MAESFLQTADPAGAGAAGAHARRAPGAADVTQMVGDAGLRLRSGVYRVILTETETTVDVMAVGHRRDIFR